MAKNEKTAKKNIASTAGKLLRDPKAHKNVRSIPASALKQAPDKRRPRKKT